jgi:hypothetical protein
MTDKFTYEDFTGVLSAIVDKRKVAEAKIKDILIEFEKETGVSIGDVRAEGTEYFVGDQGKPMVKNWSVKLELSL